MFEFLCRQSESVDHKYLSTPLKSARGFLSSPKLIASSHFVLLSNILIPETADVQRNLVGWCDLTGLELYSQGSYEKPVVGSGKLGGSKISAVLDKSPDTAYECMIDLLRCTTAIGVPSPVVQVRSLEPVSIYHQPLIFREV